MCDDDRIPVEEDKRFFPQPTTNQLKRQAIIKKWKNNELSLHEATYQLHLTGIEIHEAWDILQRT
jgi:hypothetical protein